MGAQELMSLPSRSGMTTGQLSHPYLHTAQPQLAIPAIAMGVWYTMAPEASRGRKSVAFQEWHVLGGGDSGNYQPMIILFCLNYL